jgi:broad specificity phosphatase PhoE
MALDNAMVYYVRHGESQANLNETFAGSRDDCILTDKGRLQAKAAGEDIKRKGLHFARILTSPLRRTQESATIIARDIGFNEANIETDARLIEYDMGSLTGQPMPKAGERLVIPPDAEDVHDFQQRVMQAVRAVDELPGDTLIVGHAGVGKVIEATRLHHPPDIFHDLDGYPHGQVIALAFLEQ